MRVNMKPMISQPMMRNGRIGLLAVPVLAVLVACGGGAEKSINSAREHLAKGDTKSAVIEAKNALQKDPESGQARYLLGASLLESGDVVAAEVELRKAYELKVAADDVVPKLTKAMLGTRNIKKLADEFGAVKLSTGKANAELQTNLAMAYVALGSKEKFETAVTAALAADPMYEPALIARARAVAAQNKFDEAFAQADAILVKSPSSAEAWRLKGDIFHLARKQTDAAIEAYRKALELKPDLVTAHSSLLSIFLAQSKLEEARKQLAALSKVAPNNPQTRLLQAQLAYQSKDYKVARDQTQLLLRVAPNNPRILQLAGAVEYQLGSYLQAEVMLNKALSVSPDLVLARRMLISTYLRSGQPAKALTTLNQGVAKGIVDPEINSIAGEVYLQNGDAKKAEEYFAKAAKESPNDPRKRTSLALTKLSGSGSEAALSELQDIAANDTGVTADMALISAHLRRSEYEKALKAIASLEKKQPDKPLAPNLRGRTQLALKDVAGARKSFERALQLDPLFFQATASLAALDLADKKPEDARKRFETVLAKEPKHPQALLALAELAARTGASKDEVAASLRKAIEANPTEPAPRVLLINVYLADKDYKKASNVAQESIAALPENPDILEAQGRVQQAAGETNQAITTFNKLVALQPLSPKPLLRLAEAQVANKSMDSAMQSLKKALDIKPDLVDAQRGLIALSMELKRPNEALATAKAVQKQRPKEAIGYVLEGDIHGAQKNWDAAVASYRTGLKEAPAAELAIKVHAALGLANKQAEADRFAATWLKDNPKDPAFPFYMGDSAIARKDYEGAEKAYETVVKLQPTNAAAYNNLAWVSGRLKRPGAIGLAEKALQLAPDHPSFLDTLAMLQSEAKNHDKALELQSKALKAAPDNGLFKLNLARIYINSGKKEEARKVLDELAKLGDKFPGQSEVASLAKTL
jgi:cellulose synthase operon protein C